MVVPDARVELEIGGVQVDVTDHVRHGTRITHTRGRRNRGGRAEAAEVALTLESPGGLYDNRNPRSPYYGQLGRNTPLRLSVESGVVALQVSGANTGARASTPDHASLDITGDLDVRLDATLDNWLIAGDNIDVSSVQLAGKGNIFTPDRSWLLITRHGRLQFEWSATGATTIETASTVPLPVPSDRRMAVRVTLDVNNGSSGNTVRFYTAPTMAGPWTQLGAPVVTPGTTSIFASTGPLRVGLGWTGLAFQGSSGSIHGFEMRSGINGTVVASPDFTAQTSGASSFTDPQGKLWSTTNGAEITSRRIRVRGEVPTWAPRWHLSGNNITAPITAAGIIRRLEAGREALQSTLRRRIPSEPSCVAYWPMEEGEDAVQAYSPFPRVPPLRTVGFDFGADNSLVGSDALPRLTGGAASSMDALVPPHPATGEWMVTYVYKIDAAPATATKILEFAVSGTVRRMIVTLEPGGLYARGYDADGDQILSVGGGTTPAFYATWNRLEVLARPGALPGQVTYHLGWIDVSGGGHANVQTITATAGIVTRIVTKWDASGDGQSIGHLGVFNSQNTLIYNGADDGFQGEDAADRIIRLTGEEAVPMSVGVGETTLMGPQRPGQLLALLEEAEDADGGRLYELSGRLALGYQPRVALYNREPVLTLDYGQLTQPFEPIEDDSVRNDITVSRQGGSSARVRLDDGPMSVREHPDGIGPYQEPVTLNLFHDGQPEAIAGWMVSHSAWDEYRWPRLRLLLHKYPQLVPQAVAVAEGDIIRIVNLPDHLPPGPLDLMVEGFSETFGEREWTIDFVCSPAGPWTVGVAEDPVLGRADTEGSELTVGVAAGDPSWAVSTTAGPRWIDSAAFAAMFPFSVTCGGEEVTVTAINGTGTTQTFVVTRSINGIVKAHPTGTRLRLTHPMRAAL
ncbi:hypothetical protein [Streptomyces albipurpureus]|uniref:Uncharacterized protein n=1 Tax=Streptomyces albipurpureus TaxID=2897419 RepID=A0ABT0V0U0_9ACTN|nr:hypothetical protein [Streptomyces sp. CWNU-1]MCM2394365.1 hypothetical protein [Streptomyces sp. CWNU-1]